MVGAYWLLEGVRRLLLLVGVVSAGLPVAEGVVIHRHLGAGALGCIEGLLAIGLVGVAELLQRCPEIGDIATKVSLDNLSEVRRDWLALCVDCCNLRVSDNRLWRLEHLLLKQVDHLLVRLDDVSCLDDVEIDWWLIHRLGHKFQILRLRK
jgi:hypothetical protein